MTDPAIIVGSCGVLCWCIAIALGRKRGRGLNILRAGFWGIGFFALYLVFLSLRDLL